MVMCEVSCHESHRRQTVRPRGLPCRCGPGFSAAGIAAGPFPDKNLEEAIRAVLKHEPKVELTDEKLQNVYILEAPGRRSRT